MTSYHLPYPYRTSDGQPESETKVNQIIYRALSCQAEMLNINNIFQGLRQQQEVKVGKP